MKLSKLIVCASLVLSGHTLAQDSASVGASGRSNASVSANRSGASASQDGAASAAAVSEHASANLDHGTEMNATLSRPVNARKAKPGDEVTARLDDVQSSGDVMLPRGTTLIGRVTEAQPRSRRSSGSAAGSGASRLGIVFDRAVLDDGREVPVNAAIQAVAAAEAAVSSRTRGFDGDAFGSGRAAGSGRAGGAILGGAAGAGGGLGGVGGAVGGTVATAGGIGGGIAGSASSTVGAAARTSSGAAGRVSAGAVGGLDAGGRLVSGSRGVFGMRGVEIVSASTAAAHGSVLTSATDNVELDRGTQMLLATSGNASGAAGAATQAGGGAGRAAGSAAGAASARGATGPGVVGNAGRAAGGASASGGASGSVSGAAGQRN